MHLEEDVEGVRLDPEDNSDAKRLFIGTAIFFAFNAFIERTAMLFSANRRRWIEAELVCARFSASFCRCGAGYYHHVVDVH